MKQLFKSMILVALGALMVVSCQEKPTPEPAEKPVVTADMYSVTVNSETGDVTFKFVAADLDPYWTVVDPNGAKESFYDREITKKYEVPGLYTGSIVAFGEGGESDPVQFTFNPLGEVDNTLSATENILMSQPWKPYTIVYYDGEGDTYWEWDSESVPASAADDRLTFKKDGEFVLSLGENTAIYHDMNAEYAGATITGAEKWAYVVENGAEYIQFSEGGFPGMLADDEGINAKYELRNVTANRFELHYYQAAQEQSLNFVFVSENFVDEPVDNGVTEESTVAALSGKTFYVSAYGWCAYGDGAWEWFEEPLPESTVEDRITFNADGTLVINLGENLLIYHDGGWRTIETGWHEDEQWQVTGSETWAVQSDPTGVYVKFDNGGFPLMCASSNVEGPDYNLGVDGKWTVPSIAEDGTVRVEIYQSFNEQWFTVFLTPVE